MKRLCLLLLSLGALVPSRAALLGHDVEITSVPGWRKVDPREPGQQSLAAPTLKYIPKDGRNAAIILTLLPNVLPGLTVQDLPSLKIFNVVSARPYLADPEAPPPVMELKIRHGLGVYLVNEDPALVGKPAPPGEYKFATSASVLLGGQYLIHCTIFHDAPDSDDFHEAMDILQSAVIGYDRSDKPI